MVEINRDKMYDADEPIHQGYRAGADKVYSEREREKAQKKKMEDFRKGLGIIKDKYLNNKQ